MLHKRDSVWWRDFVLINDCSGSKGLSASDVIISRIKNDTKMAFWFSKWIGDQALVEAFLELYARAAIPFISVAEAGHWENEEWWWDVHNRFSSEEEKEVDLLQFLVTQLAQVRFMQKEIDRFKWAINVEEGFSVNSCAAMIRKRGELPLLEEAELKKLKFLWNLEAPSKVKVLALRLILDRNPTRH